MHDDVQGLRRIARQKMDRGKIVVGGDKLGLKPERLFEVLRGVAQVSLRQERFGKIVVRFGVGRIERQALSVGGNRVIQFPQL